MGWARRIVKKISSWFKGGSRRRAFGYGGLRWLFQTGGSAGTFRFVLDEASVVGGGTFGFYVLRTIGSVGTVVVQVRSVDGTAIAGVDYTVIGPTTLTFVNGQVANVPVMVKIENPTSQKTFTLEIYSVSGTAAIDPVYGEVEVTIDPIPGTPGTISFYEYWCGQKESSTLTIPVKRSGGSSGAVSVQYATIDGSAVAGVDYDYAAGTLNWADGDTADKNITVTLNAVGTDKYFFVLLSSPGGGAVLTPRYCITRISAYIYDVPPAAGYLGFSWLNIQAPESAVLTVYVKRVGGSTGAVQCNYATANDTAVAGTHYTTASGTLNWADGDDADKSFNVTILGVDGNDRRFTISLSAFGGGSAAWPGRDVASVLIQNATEPPPVPLLDELVDFSAEPAVFSEDIYDVIETLAAQDTLVLPNNALAGGVLGYDGGTGSFGGGLDLASDDESLLPSMTLRHQHHEMVESEEE